MATAPVSSVLCKSSRPYRKNVCGGNATHPLLRVIRGPSTSGPFSATDWRVDRATFGDAQRHTEKGRTGNLAEQGPARRSECSWPVWQNHLVTYTSRRYGDVLLFCLALVDVDFWDVSSWGKYSHTGPATLAPLVPCPAGQLRNRTCARLSAARGDQLAGQHPPGSPCGTICR